MSEPETNPNKVNTLQGSPQFGAQSRLGQNPNFNRKKFQGSSDTFREGVGSPNTLKNYISGQTQIIWITSTSGLQYRPSGRRGEYLSKKSETVGPAQPVNLKTVHQNFQTVSKA